LFAQEFAGLATRVVSAFIAVCRRRAGVGWAWCLMARVAQAILRTADLAVIVVKKSAQPPAPESGQLADHSSIAI
jgi:hypothetical protein